VLDALQARTTVLEGRVRFLECELQVGCLFFVCTLEQGGCMLRAGYVSERARASAFASCNMFLSPPPCI